MYKKSVHRKKAFSGVQFFMSQQKILNFFKIYNFLSVRAHQDEGFFCQFIYRNVTELLKTQQCLLSTEPSRDHEKQFIKAFRRKTRMKSTKKCQKFVKHLCGCALHCIKVLRSTRKFYWTQQKVSNFIKKFQSKHFLRVN